jgi:hypothetical protein
MIHRKLQVYLVYLGPHAAVNLGRLVVKLNGLQHAFDFRLFPDAVFGGSILPFQLDDLNACDIAPFFTDGAIMTRLRKVLDRYPEIDARARVIVVTNARLTRGNECTQDPPDIGDFLGLWAPESVVGDRRFGVISLALYLDRYEERARRTAEQYVAFLLLAYLGDTLIDPKPTHRDFRFCVFDYNDDLESIVSSIRRSAICERCRERIAQTLPSDPGVSGHSLLAAFDGVLAYVRKPRVYVVWKTLQSDPLFSLFIIGIAAGIAINIATGLIGVAVAPQIIALGVLLLAGIVWIFKQHFLPGPLFR